MIIRKIEPPVTVKRVAAYARVSTLTEEQEESYETQVSYYTDLIRAMDGWELVGVYADRGISGTKAAKRPQFMQMIQDARDGKLDIILCKSISRFSRNAGEAQTLVHELKSLNVEVRFEKEGINTFDSSTDFIFSLYAALAQEESRSISENVKWTYRRLAEQGIRHLGNNRVLGYDEVNGKLTPNKDAWIIRMIFEEYAYGLAPSSILKHLEEAGAHRIRSQKNLTGSHLRNILRNEIYVGDRLLQKTYPRNYLTKKPDPNEPYESRYIYNDHEGIVTPAVWDAVQDRLRREQQARKNGLYYNRRSHFFYGKVFCGNCGEPYCRRGYTTPKKELYRCWVCRDRISSGKCRNPQISENFLKDYICDEMGWSKFDEWVFLESVDKVLVYKGHIKVIKAQGTNDEEQPDENA